MDTIEHMVYERLEARKRELKDAKKLSIPCDGNSTEYTSMWNGKRIMLEGTTGEIPFLERLLDKIQEGNEE